MTLYLLAVSRLQGITDISMQVVVWSIGMLVVQCNGRVPIRLTVMCIEGANLDYYSSRMKCVWTDSFRLRTLSPESVTCTKFRLRKFVHSIMSTVHRKAQSSGSNVRLQEIGREKAQAGRMLGELVVGYTSLVSHYNSYGHVLEV